MDIRAIAQHAADSHNGARGYVDYVEGGLMVEVMEAGTGLTPELVVEVFRPQAEGQPEEILGTAHFAGTTMLRFDAA